MGLVLLKLMALLAGVAVVGIAYCLLEKNQALRWRRRRNRRER